VSGGETVSARLEAPSGAHACYLFAHGAGADMEHPFMRAIAAGLAARGIASLRYQFPYTQRGARRPDPPPLCHATVRAAAAEAARLLPDLPLLAGGRSFGGRMTSQAQALAPLPNVRGLAFFGFPLHPAGAPAVERAQHLERVALPMLFLQGTRDALAERTRMEGVLASLGPRARVLWVEDADHSFHVPARSGRSDADVRAQLLEEFAAWLETLP
jgi:predicted alpha/beta-hydrolase family hydrolase